MKYISCSEQFVELKEEFLDWLSLIGETENYKGIEFRIDRLFFNLLYDLNMELIKESSFRLREEILSLEDRKLAKKGLQLLDIVDFILS